ncbi:hypothetical protein DENSPDRAFT_852229 [Dentipellis sp. KUC8613]|nr:hypothetical protein DENSPDRAFT_852229 [Dentipellis sp. KUC8613]
MYTDRCPCALTRCGWRRLGDAGTGQRGCQCREEGGQVAARTNVRIAHVNAERMDEKAHRRCGWRQARWRERVCACSAGQGGQGTSRRAGRERTRRRRERADVQRATHTEAGGKTLAGGRGLERREKNDAGAEDARELRQQRGAQALTQM